MKIIDTHQHLWDVDRFNYSWLQRAPALNRSFSINDYQDATSGLDVIKSIHVEADVNESFMLAETRYILELAERDDNPIEGVVACARPESSEFREYLENFASHPKLKGIRRIFHTQPDELILHPLLIENLRALPDYNLSFDLCVLARQLPLAIKLVESCPHVSFILDHCANPPIKERAPDPWRSHLQTIASLPNVICKISGLVTNANQENWTAADLQPYVEHVIESFGWDRVVFGSDWPVCTLAGSYKIWLETLARLTQSSTPEERDKLFYGNANVHYRLL